MYASAKPQDGGTRGVDLLLQHCQALDRLGESHPPAFERLADAIGRELATMLVSALTAEGGSRVRGLYAA